MHNVEMTMIEGECDSMHNVGMTMIEGECDSMHNVGMKGSVTACTMWG